MNRGCKHIIIRADVLDPPTNEVDTSNIIETSHIVMHTWDESVPANVQLDVYTCAEFDTKIVFKWLEQFNPTKIDYKYLDREHGLKEIQINE